MKKTIMSHTCFVESHKIILPYWLRANEKQLFGQKRSRLPLTESRSVDAHPVEYTFVGRTQKN